MGGLAVSPINRRLFVPRCWIGCCRNGLASSVCPSAVRMKDQRHKLKPIPQIDDGAQPISTLLVEILVGSIVIIMSQGAQQFRSVLPHEPLPQEAVGYIHLQGAFEPKKKDPEAPIFW